jgi:hypothetical protein
MVAADLRRRGNRILFPYGEDCDYDLVAERPDGRFERVQVKHTASDGAVILVRCRSNSVTNGRVRATKAYTAATIDWLAVYDATSDRCYYLPRDGTRCGTVDTHPAAHASEKWTARRHPRRGRLPIL